MPATETPAGMCWKCKAPLDDHSEWATFETRGLICPKGGAR